MKQVSISTYLLWQLIILVVVSFITLFLYLHYSYIPYHRAMRRVSSVSKRLDRKLLDVADYIISHPEKFDSISVQKAKEMFKK